ncbi:hypothetical protein VTJ49DRAFT_7097 [Mycothermus thermophilus]|uniref:Myb-like domain-containing protein n=1 Tax=Humicola insolens TaxID=85995 RepID=A0ABR3VJ65_HUMIN
MNKNWNDKADKDLFFTILSVKNIGVISGSEWVTIGTHMRSLGYGFTNEGCRQHFQGLRRAQAKVENGLANGNNPRRIDPTLDPITRRPGPGRGRPRKQPAAAGDAANAAAPTSTTAPGQAGNLTPAPGAPPPPPPPPPPPHAVGAPGGAQLPPGTAPPPAPGAAAAPPHPASHMQVLPPHAPLHPQYPGHHVLTGQPHPYAVPGGPGGPPPPHHPMQPVHTSGAPKPYMPPPPPQGPPGPHSAGPVQMSHPGNMGVGMAPQAPMAAGGPDGLPNVVHHDDEDDEEDEDGHETKRQKLEPGADNEQENAATGTSAEDEAVLNALAAHNNGSGNHPATPAEYPSEYTYGDV